MTDEPPPRIREAVGLPIRLYVSADITVRRELRRRERGLARECDRRREEAGLTTGW